MNHCVKLRKMPFVFGQKLEFSMNFWTTVFLSMTGWKEDWHQWHKTRTLHQTNKAKQRTDNKNSERHSIWKQLLCGWHLLRAVTFIYKMASNDFSIVSSSDSEVSEIEDYESEVKGSPNSSNQATDVKEKQEAYSNKLIADAEWLLLYEQEKRTETELEKNTPKALQWTVLNIAPAKDNTFLKHFFQLWLACSDQIRNQCNSSLGFKSQITLDPYPFGEFCGPCYGLSNLDSSPLWKFIDNSSFHQKQLDFCTTLLSITQRYFWAKKRGVIGTLMEGTFVFGPVQSWAQ